MPPTEGKGIGLSIWTITLAGAPPSDLRLLNHLTCTGDWAKETAKKVQSLKTKVVLQSCKINKTCAANVCVCCQIMDLFLNLFFICLTFIVNKYNLSLATLTLH